MFRRRYSVSSFDIDGRFYDYESLEQLLSGYAEQLKVDIKVALPHRETREVKTDKGILYIYLYCCPRHDNARGTILPSAYGMHLNSSQEDGMKPSHTLTTVYDQNAVAVAEFTSGCIFVLFDLPHGESQNELMRFIMEDYLVFIQSRDDFSRLLDDRMGKCSLENFLKIYTEGLETRDSYFEDKIKSLDEQVQEYQREIVKKTRERQRLSAKWKVTKELLKEYSDSEVIAVLEVLKKYCVGGSIRVTEDRIVIPVGQIDIEYEGVTYDIGVFDLIIDPNGDNDVVQCINQTRVVGGYYHPHVSEDGTCCLGNISDTIPDLIGRMEYELAVVLMLQFLRSCNPDGWYNEVTNWPHKRGVNES